MKKSVAIGAVALGIAAMLSGCVSTTHTASAPPAHHDTASAQLISADQPTAPTPELARKFGRLHQSDVKYSRNRSLNTAAVTERYAAMADKYQKVGQLLSPEDAEFVRTYAPQTPEMDKVDAAPTGGDAVTASDVHVIPATTKNFSKSGSGAGGTGSVSGYQYMNYSDAPWNISGNWSAKITATGSSTVTKITCIEHVRVYGLLGSSGIGLAYAADPSGTVSGKSNSYYRAATFTAYGAYWTMNYEGVFSTSRGSFSVTGS